MDLRELDGQASTIKSGARHPWETARAHFFCGVIQHHARSDRALHVLDVGAGDGFLGRALLRELAPGSRVTCFDPHYTAEHLAQFSADATPGLSFCRTLPAERFDFVLLLDVLEHVEDDAALLASLIANSLAHDGTVLVSVPAHPLLFSQHDVALGHHRRYDASALATLLNQAGLAIVRSGGLFHSLILPRAIAKLVERARGVRSMPVASAPLSHAATEVGNWQGGPMLTSALGALLALDNRASSLTANLGIALPGLSVWALAKKAAA
jgi:2-polyprenyl-3-methyl-5-hydroxy-6-metoxy-1,4-benzoquinol methylase